jgi:hypothetical protein
MPVILVKFDEPISDVDGSTYFAQAVGRLREDGLWEGWLEFTQMSEDAPSFTSGRETTQPNRADLDYWAQGLSQVYLQGALARAKVSAESGQRAGAQRESSRDV